MPDQFRIESILESFSGGFFALDREFRITYWNRAAEEGTKLLAAEVLGKNVFEVFPNSRDAINGEKYRLAMETGTFQSFETSYKDERFEFWYEVSVYPAENGLSVFLRDITEKRSERRQNQRGNTGPADQGRDRCGVPRCTHDGHSGHVLGGHRHHEQR